MVESTQTVTNEESKVGPQWPHEDVVRFVVVSDTHNQEMRMPEDLPAGDVLLHCGDMTNVGTEKELKSVNDWFG